MKNSIYIIVLIVNCFCPVYFAQTIKIQDNTIIELGNLKIKVIHTPGHTPGGVLFLVEDNLFTGDTLFVEGCGRTDLPGSNTKQMYHSLEKIKSMDENIKIYPGHDYGSMKISTIKHEKENNPYLLAKDEENFINDRLR